MAHRFHCFSEVRQSCKRLPVRSATDNVCRIILGMNGAYIGQLIRIMLSIVWYGSQAWLGGLCVSAMLSSWSYKFLTMENTLPESAHMVTRDLIGFVIFHIISVPFLVSGPSSPCFRIAQVLTFSAYPRRASQGPGHHRQHHRLDHHDGNHYLGLHHRRNRSLI